MITKIENYYLNQPVNEAPDLKEYTTKEYQMFEMAGWVKMLEDEKIYHGKETNFNGNLWNTVIGSTNGKIYKISLQIIDSDKERLENIFKSTLNYIIKEGGKYNEHTILPIGERYILDAPEGNVIYERLSKLGQDCINIFLTSNLIRKQTKNNSLGFFKIKSQKINQFLGWNPLEHSDEENLRWSWLRAVEWGIWPAFLSGPIVPLLLPFFEWWKVIGIVVVLTVLWSFIRYKYVNLTMASFGVYFVSLKWVVCPAVAIYLNITAWIYTGCISSSLASISRTFWNFCRRHPN
jgi:hypothetical protein